MTTVTLLLPLPPRALSPNARPHWATRMRAAKAYRYTAWAEAMVQIPPPLPHFERARLSVFFIVGNRGIRGRDEYRPADQDNAISSFIAGQNGLVDAGLLSADDAEHLSVRCCVVRAQMKGGLVAVCIEGETG